MNVHLAPGRRTAPDEFDTATRFAVSAAVTDSAVTPMAEFHRWYAGCHDRMGGVGVVPIPFAAMSGWHFEPDTGNLVHDTGRFFTIEGLRVRTDRPWVSDWTQPIIVQPEIGILGILVKEFDGVLHCLMQAKMEPGNVNRVQISPTVQATRSNYTRVHNGTSIPYLDYFRRHPGARVLVDVLQSEQAAWFLHKRNRNVVVEVFDDVPVGADFHWLTLGQIRRLLRMPHVVNMDARTVLSCLPTALAGPVTDCSGDGFAEDVRRSTSGEAEPVHTMGEVLSWLTDIRTTRELIQQRIALEHTAEGGWLRTADQISHQDGKFFRVIAVDVHSAGREVASWTQPLIAPNGPGLLAFLTRRINGFLHVLVQAKVDAGAMNVAEMAPTVHCYPGNYRDVPQGHRPPYLDVVLSAHPGRIRYDTMHSEEGGRFFHAMNRYVVIEVDEDFPVETPPGYCWMTLNQLTGLLVHGNYLNVELRSLVACIQAA
ncbi:NDP-hexose 2,3-dehydratase family protein [Kibdelosporangium persicum]|uniref:D-olivose, D-oliose and D-mycarose 2,3-dehydratase n=1 Tax=Kibdelosporangium persicum TaxID=2698649 RepID=A0ABX2FKT0_9PSEU|nr:NDP-hexose 2,3-dehydratase family protein [Kibdelosporangium persicum]NRN71401.1 D-olivose, D-oliose and D-mycarose 2,3-dehydratase [Kibdelosporangium persicum]